MAANENKKPEKFQLSIDIFSKANVGLWAFELDEGSAPRMIVDDVMLGLLGLEHQVSPEETYHAWYDHIDESSYDLVSWAVEKMASGEFAEVQYPWHHPDGRTMVVRCGGVRNFNYTAGTRIEGTHQDVTQVQHFDEEEINRLRKAQIQLQHEQLRSDVLNYMIDNDDDPIELLKNFAERLRVLIGCDQVIYRDLEETRIMVNSPAIEKTWSVPIEYCRQCQHFDAHHSMYKDGYTEMNNCQEGWQGIPVFHKCPIKSSLTRIVYRDKEVAGYLAIHYVVNYHQFTDIERNTLEEFTRILSISLSRYEARKENKELKLMRALSEQKTISDGLSREYHTVWLMEGKGRHNMHLFRSTGVKTIQSAVQIALDDPSYDDGIIKYIEQNVHVDDQKRVLEESKFETIERMTPEIGTYVVSYRRYNKDHTDFDYHQMCFARATAEDGSVNYIYAFRDADKMLREQMKQQEQLQEALSMAQSANRAKTTFLNNMSHDIRTPMNAIIGYTGLAASHIDNKEQVQNYLAKINQSSDHLLSLINDVLDMSRIESGKMNIEEKEENISDLIHTLKDIVQADINAKHQDFYVDAVGVHDENIICDKLRLNQVLLNILSNAIKYTDAGGMVTMRVEEKAVKDSGYATYEFRIKDNGMGMSEEFLKTIFDPFTRVKSSTVSGIQGTGLGMAITKNIVDMMGGTIDIKSAPSVGTEVKLLFDFKLQSAPAVPVEIPELKGTRGLIVDDDTDNCMSIAKMLKEIGMRSLWCTSGKEAVIRTEDAVKNNDLYRLYIIDWIMPDMNGIETTRRIRKVIGDDAPIIILTAYDWADIEEEAREAGVTAFVSKPMFPSDLTRVLNKCLGKEAASAEASNAFPDFKGKKVLLVEDNDLNREIATAILQEFNCEVIPAEDGDVAVEKVRTAKNGDFDLILMDIQMPRMNGYEATRQIRALGTDISRVPILAMTANAFEEDRKAALKAGMNEHIAKPIDMEQLKKLLSKFLNACS